LRKKKAAATSPTWLKVVVRKTKKRIDLAIDFGGASP
jgi:hypothetical protein